MQSVVKSNGGKSVVSSTGHVFFKRAMRDNEAIYGGELSAHIHDSGWVSGSIYINVPPKSKKDSGNLVVTTHDPKDGKPGSKDIKSIDVITGSLCLFEALKSASAVFTFALDEISKGSSIDAL